jgi:hypothetical protein
MADPTNPDEPERPGTPKPLGEYVAPLMRNVALVKLADEIIASTEQHVVLLEDHRMGMMGLPAHKDPADKLAAAGFSFCAEMDERVHDHRSSVGLVLTVPPRRESQKRVSEELSRAGNELTAASQPQASALRVHRVGDILVSAKEGLEAARKELGKTKLRLEDLYIEPLKMFIQLHEKTLGKDPKFKALKRSAEKNHPKLGFPLALFDFITILMTFHSNDNIEFFAKRLCETNGMPQDLLTMVELTKEIKTLAQQTDEWRHTGEADKNTAKNALSALRGRRGLFVIGAAHGILADNPASLPEQLVQQSKGKSKATVRLIQLMNKECAQPLYNTFVGYASNNVLRPNVTVYDFERGQKWASVEEWMREAPSLYGFPAKDIGPAPGAPPTPA